MYKEEMMTFDNMKQLIGIAMFSLMMCIMAMFTLNGCCRNENNGVGMIDTIDTIGTVLVDTIDTIDTMEATNYVMRPNVDSCMVVWNKRK